MNGSFFYLGGLRARFSKWKLFLLRCFDRKEVHRTARRPSNLPASEMPKFVRLATMCVCVCEVEYVILSGTREPGGLVRLVR